VRKAQAAEILARRLGLDARRIDNLCLRLSDRGMFPRADGSRRFPPVLNAPHLARMLVTALADQGMGKTPGVVTTVENLRDKAGNRLADVLTRIIEGGDAIGAIARGSLIVRTEPAGASIVLDGLHTCFGAPPPDSAPARAIGVPGTVLAAIALEFGGHSQKDADAIVALAQITPLSSAAFQPKDTV
jgi:hypothetical protein